MLNQAIRHNEQDGKEMTMIESFPFLFFSDRISLLLWFGCSSITTLLSLWSSASSFIIDTASTMDAFKNNLFGQLKNYGDAVQGAFEQRIGKKISYFIHFRGE